MKKVLLVVGMFLALALGISTGSRPAKADGGPLILCPPQNCGKTCQCQGNVGK